MTLHDDSLDPVATFHRLHASGCFVMPNPWDVGSARALEQLGFPALATTSAGLAWTLGRADNQVTLDQALEHLRAVAAAVHVPVNADFEGGFAVEPDGVAANVDAAADDGHRRALDRGLLGRRRRAALRRSSWPWNGSGPRARPSTRAAPASSSPAVRRDSCVGRPDIDETIRRLQAYAEAGADCLYAPRLDAPEHIAADRRGGGAQAGQPAHQRAVHHRCRGGRGSACGGSASAARSPAPPGRASSTRPRRSRTPEPSRGSRACRTSTRCWASEP